MEEVFSEEVFFADRARSILDTRNDVGYVRLLDHNGVLEKSFGFQDDKGFEKLTLKGPEGKTVLLGLRSSVGKNFNLDALLWSLIFASLMAVVLTSLIRFISDRAFRFMGEFSEAVGSVASGDYSVRLDGRSSLIAGAGVQWLCREFNEMASSLEGGSADRDDTEDLEDADFDRSDELPTDFRPKIVLSPEQSSDVSSFQAPQDSFDEGLVEIVHVEEVEEEDAEPEQEAPSAVTEIADSEGKKADISILVVKIADFETLIEDVSPSSVNSLTADYRKSVSTTISSFGGTVEAILRDEVVAFFTSPGPGPAAKLNCVCCAVEMMQLFAGVVDGQKVSTRSDIKLKMGISSADLPVSDESDVFALAKPFVDEAKSLCDGARAWSVFVTTGFREGVSDYLEVRREKVDGNLCYAVTGVEEEALQRTGR
ncbi:MAG: hypothetical protein F4235_05325 [Candidatus Dadabacteria bacterium]|nr:hypothetical protein [Candidatus Dadabacteria bacterium]MYE61455.1 hypothetical protein [Candidatus Dadabacteria bacterium]